MTIKRLEEYADIRREILDLERRIERCRRGVVADTVKGSPDFPYAKRTITVRGIGRRDAGKAAKLRRLLSEQRDRLEAETLEIEAFLGAIDDSKVRQIIRLHCIEGYSWAATASKVYGYPGESRARKCVVRYLEKL